jgi:hypothetical protein
MLRLLCIYLVILLSYHVRDICNIDLNYPIKVKNLEMACILDIFYEFFSKPHLIRTFFLSPE